MKKIRKIIIILLIILIVLLIGYIVYDKCFNKEEEPIKVEKRIDDYGYTLDENETNIYKEEFYNLEKILESSEVDYEAYAKSIAKLFIIDFYTLDNKLSKNDIGGVEFLKPSMRDNFIEQARSTFYKYVEVKKGRTQKLPIVSSVDDIELEKTTYTIKKITKTTSKKGKTPTNVGDIKEAYKLNISWSYKEDLGYEDTTTMYMIKENDKLYIVEMN